MAYIMKTVNLNIHCGICNAHNKKGKYCAIWLLIMYGAWARQPSTQRQNQIRIEITI
jgi:hypothetical protein